ncbi:EAL domain-containing protein [Sediminicoccus sp. KRV36]|uniref:putative bifunctional diguanylate cyclase/phosphodiesterase n=1 Tax=Sediminicoccus sp. KRV36 TaxID=3133721 RepID=UPI00200E26D3|nr:EAL domain-containing protein [Sediminicoccus rosea]UPY36069.1 EAL domain-containing protein [Sediminicoccus rosea]
MKTRRRSALDARFAIIAAICLVLAELVGSHFVTQWVLRRELLRAHDAATAQTELMTAMAAPGLRFNRGASLEAALLPITARNPALMAARFERADGLVVHDWARTDFPLAGAWWQRGTTAHDADVIVISRAAMGADGAVVGRVSIAWDQRPIFAEATTQFRTVGAISVLVSLAFGGLGLLLLRRRLRRFRQAEEATRDLAMRDPLTGILNRRGLTEAQESEEFAEAWASGAPIMLALADLDGFKPVNDTYGHAAGDELLKQIAHRLDCEVARQGIAARLGGDEFALMLLLDPADPYAAAEDAAKRLMGVVRVPFTLHPDGSGAGGGSVQVRVGLSLGIALTPDDAEDAAELMRRADSALYRAKAEGRGRFRRFTPEMDPRLGKRRGAMRLEAELREALTQDVLTCHYQPIRQLASGQLLGFEALARWPHPTRGFVSPSEFIPIAEANGLIVPLTDLLLRRACRDAAAWPEPLTLSFNLSPLHLAEADLPRQVAQILAEAGLPPGRLQLELTEGALLGDLRSGHAMLSELKALGVRLALDDFGTGHSGLRELQALPFDVIKVDNGFVRAMASDAGARKIVAAIIGLGESLGLPVVAEGIEEQLDVDFLTRLGCDMGQGWLLGRPMPAEQAQALMPLRADPRRAAA